MKTLLQAGALVQQIFERRDWTFCFIGGVANFRWGTRPDSPMISA